jgi:hypothetical protein
MVKRFMDHFAGITGAQSKDTGMAFVLLLLIVWYFTRQDAYVVAAIVVHVISMTAPQVFRPLAVFWFALSHLLGTVMSRVILTTAFFGVVVPIGLFMRLVIRRDGLQLQAFKAGRGSVMRERNHTYISRDLQRPY